MNAIANFGKEVGNFIFVDTFQEGWQAQLESAMQESLEIALESCTTLKFSLTNQPLGYAKTGPASLSYIKAPEEEEQKEEIYDRLVTYTEIVETKILNGNLRVSLTTRTANLQLEVVIF